MVSQQRSYPITTGFYGDEGHQAMKGKALCAIARQNLCRTVNRTIVTKDIQRMVNLKSVTLHSAEKIADVEMIGMSMGKQKRPDFSCVHAVAQQLLAKFRRDVNQQLIINNRGRVCTNVFSLTYTGLLTVLAAAKRVRYPFRRCRSQKMDLHDFLLSLTGCCFYHQKCNQT